MEAQNVIVAATLDRDEHNVDYRCECNNSSFGHQAQMIVFVCPSCEHVSDHQVCQQWPISEFDCDNCSARIRTTSTITNAR